jgi:hypothetical protein
VSSGSLTPTITSDTAGEAHPFLRFAESFEPLGPRPVPEVMTAAIQGAASSFAAGNLSTEVNVDLAGAGGNRGTQVATIERKLSEHPADIREAALALSKALADEIERLNAVRPNDHEPQARHDDFVAFLRQLRDGLNGLADSIERAVAAGSAASPEPVLLGKAGEIARQLGGAVTEGLQRNRDYIVDCAIQFSVFATGFMFL